MNKSADDLLYRTGSGNLPIDITSVVSNHTDVEPIVRHHGVRFHHVPVAPDTKQDAENRLLGIVARWCRDFEPALVSQGRDLGQRLRRHAG